jgi:hypothetical protein
LGQHIAQIPPENLQRIGLLVIISTNFSILSTTLGKTSFAFTLLRLTDGWMRKLVWVLIFTINLFMGLCLILLWTKCSPVEKAWKPYLPGHCMDRKSVEKFNIFSAGKIISHGCCHL